MRTIITNIMILTNQSLGSNNMQNYKKQGLDEAQNEFLCSQKGIFLRGIPQRFIINPRVDLSHLSCQICGNIIWKAVTCSQPNCFANYCEYCVSNLSQQGSRTEMQPNFNCPHCNRQFFKTTIPLINNLLSDLQLKCLFMNQGCCQTIKYDQFLKHCIGCDFRRIPCQGCKKNFIQKAIQDHKKTCSSIVVTCPKCNLQLPQSNFKAQHTQVKCLQYQLQIKTNCISRLQKNVQLLKEKLNQYENLMDKIIKGDYLQLPYQIYSSFPTNFTFTGSEVKLCKSSWNVNKQKFDFLHFYVTSRIKTQSPIGYQWKLLVKVLKGNLLIGICSSLLVNSVDFVINRFGQIKKKQSIQNKYKLIRKGNLTFSQGDIISFKYIALRKILKIQNETKKVECKLQIKQICELGESLYSFYSLDTTNDTIKFI